ncbi:phospholipase [Aliidiomarina minuta]|uniref:phospholipase D n=1 Tax=Aliidiomarina minuta TaxID=880057 RepID=A0A432WA47_9GAMM|nr:phospholipase D-like domain-containing protein [Aliidiomarina minuta]RUO26905.1 phospholipase [Aliidiomarina minuta]
MRNQKKLIIMLLLLVLVIVGVYQVHKPLPAGLNFEGPPRSATDVEFLADITYTDTNGERQIEQQIFDTVFEMIAEARKFVLVDMFLFNDFKADERGAYRPLATELTEALIAQKDRYPDLEVWVISDPLNNVYGGRTSAHFEQLREADIPVVITDLTRLRDSNPLYSAFWRPFIQPFGNSEGGILPNPFGEGRVSLRSYLKLLNFKANHRKLVITDNNNQLTALVTSANPHDPSSAHGNVALRFSGPAAWDLLASEAAVLNFSGRSAPETDLQPMEPPPNSDVTVQVVTERAVERTLLRIINEAVSGEKLDLAIFYLSDRHVVRALQDAVTRGVQVRVLLDPNKEAFGHEKIGVPNLPVAQELNGAGVSVRWCDTQDEQCHSKWLLYRDNEGRAEMLLGSTNFTRRNLHNLNLETSVVLRGEIETESLQQGLRWFEDQWSNREDRQFSVDYATYAEESLWLRFLYRTMEATGISTF